MIERALPADENYRQSGYFQNLVQRHEFARVLIHGKRVLDTCCGSAWGTHAYFARDSRKIIAADRSIQGLKTYGHHDINPTVCDSTALCFPAESFDVVVALESIEHFTRQDANNYVSEMARVLTSDGILVGSTPLCISDALIPLFQEENPYHLFAFTEKELQLLLHHSFTELYIAACWNVTQPYWIFLAAKHPGRFQQRDVSEFRARVEGEQPGSRSIRAQKLHLWSDELDRRGHRAVARRALADAVRDTPLNANIWRGIARLYIPPPVWQSIRRLVNRGRPLR